VKDSKDSAPGSLFRFLEWKWGSEQEWGYDMALYGVCIESETRCFLPQMVSLNLVDDDKITLQKPDTEMGPGI